MIRFTKTAAAAFVAAATVGAFANPAAAQGLPRFCTNLMSTNSFYSNVLSTGQNAEVEYHGQFQNQDYQNQRTITARMSVVVAKFGNWEIRRRITTFTLAPNEQKDVIFLVLGTHNPGGQGAPTPAAVGSQIRFDCSFTPRPR
jgi:hypothetical protein